MINITIIVTNILYVRKVTEKCELEAQRNVIGDTDRPVCKS